MPGSGTRGRRLTVVPTREAVRAEAIDTSLENSRLSRLCCCAVPGQADGVDFCGCRLIRARWLIFGGDQDAAELADHVRGRWPALLVYQGARARWLVHVGGVVPGGGVPRSRCSGRRAGTGRCGDRAGGRLRACPVPKTCLASSIAISMVHAAAYRSMTCAAVAAVSVVTSARS